MHCRVTSTHLQLLCVRHRLLLQLLVLGCQCLLQLGQLFLQLLCLLLQSLLCSFKCCLLSLCLARLCIKQPLQLLDLGLMPLLQVL